MKSIRIVLAPPSNGLDGAHRWSLMVCKSPINGLRTFILEETVHEQECDKEICHRSKKKTD